MNEIVSPFEINRLHFDYLKRCAYFKIVSKSVSPVKRAIHNACRILVWVIVVMYNLQNIVLLVQVHHDADQVVGILYILLVTLNSIIKQIVFNGRSHRIERIIDTIKGPVFMARNLCHVEIVKKNAAMMQRLLRVYIVFVILIAIIWFLYPIINKFLGVDVQFTVYFPFPVDSTPTFEIAAFYSSAMLGFQACGQVAMDCTLVAFYVQATAQLQMLRYSLEHLVDLDDDGQEMSDSNMRSKVEFLDLENERYKQVLQTRLVQCVLHHQRILWYIKEIESIFTEMVLCQFFVSAWAVCMTVYKIVGLSVLSAEFLTMTSYLCSVMTELFICCYFGTQLKYESELVSQSVYSGAWLSLSAGFRRQLLIMMMNCSRPIVLMTANFIPISLDTYISILKASYSLFTLLNRK